MYDIIKIQISDTTPSWLHYTIPTLILLVHTFGVVASSILKNDNYNESKAVSLSKGKHSIYKNTLLSPRINQITIEDDFSEPVWKKEPIVMVNLAPFANIVTYIANIIIVGVSDHSSWIFSRSYLWYLICVLFIWTIIFFAVIGNNNLLVSNPKNFAQKYRLSFVLTTSFALTCNSLLFFYKLNLANLTLCYKLDLIVDISRIAVQVMFLVFYFTIRSAREDINLSNSLESQPEASKKILQSTAEYFLSFGVILKKLWPYKKYKLQFLFYVCGILLVFARIVNVMTPYQLGKVTNIINGEYGKPYMPWKDVLLYIMLRFFQGNQGLLGSLRSFVWLPLSQFAYRNLSINCLDHVLSLSMEFHIYKKTGELLSALSKGNSINNFFEALCFQLLPTFFDLVFAIVYFVVEFDSFFALIIFMMTISYIFVTYKITIYRNKYRRNMVKLSNKEFNTRSECISHYETVKYFNAEIFEHNRYKAAVSKYQNAERKVLVSLSEINIVQGSIFTFGIMSCCIYSLWLISKNRATVGSFVALISYLGQLQQPLSFFGTYFRSLLQNFIDSEKMLDVFQKKPDFVDDPDAKPFYSKKITVEFENVGFGYDERKKILKDVSFVAEEGTRIALVGESGAGKSTIYKLLFRFYNNFEGKIKFNGIEVRDLTIESIRENIAVVPQDCILFNESILYNIRYAKPEATDEEVIQAAKIAQIHDRIMTFPDRYETVTGENGVRLSGGEKQRVAIARCILKNPSLILLDEATSALDTETEWQIKSAFEALESDRTTIIIAHRLSTVVDVEKILVMDQGKIIESGTHKELLDRHGRYYQLWREQCENESRKSKAD